MKDDNHLIKVEKAIQEKYGDEAIQNPKANWDQEKEKEYLKQIKKVYKSQKPKEKVEVNGILMPKKLFNRESERTCPVCFWVLDCFVAIFFLDGFFYFD